MIELDSDDFDEYPFIAALIWDTIKYDDMEEITLENCNNQIID